MNKFKIGDKVKIIGKCEGPNSKERDRELRDFFPEGTGYINYISGKGKIVPEKIYIIIAPKKIEGSGYGYGFISTNLKKNEKSKNNI